MIDGFDGVTVIEVSCTAAPIPCRVTVCGLLLAESTTVSVPETWPMAKGVKDTLIAHDPAGGIDAGHEEEANGPVEVTLVTFKVVD
jgi:hypothetical protein